jgi:hypothetical protein
MAKQDAIFKNHYKQGYEHMLAGEVDTRYADDWTPGYRQGVLDATMNFAGV